MLPVESAAEAYQRALRTARRVFSNGRLLASTLNSVAEAVRDIARADKASMLFLSARSTSGNFLYGHTVNTAVYAMTAARALGADDSAVLDVGRAAFLHDRVRLPEELSLPGTQAGLRRLNAGLHPASVSRLFPHMLALEDALPHAPKRLQSAAPEGPVREDRRAVHESAHIIAISDLFESMSAPRPWPGQTLPNTVLMRLLQHHRRDTDRPILRVFAEQLTIHPPGSFVRLSTGDAARIMRVHPETPSKPVVEVLTSSTGPVRGPAVDLRRSAHMRILNGLSYDECVPKHPAARAMLEYSRWTPMGADRT